MKKVGIEINKYARIHYWIKVQKGKADKCENQKCLYPKINANGIVIEKPLRFEWANISGRYLRKLSDWIMLCPSCHRKKDFPNGYKPKKQIVQLTKQDEIVKVWDSFIEAQKYLGILASSIHNAIKGLSSSAGGYKWKYF